MDLKAIFERGENGALNYEQFMAVCKEGGIKLADLSGGEYVAKKKYEDELVSKDSQITKLNETIAQRDKDLAGLQTKLQEAGNDTAKLTQLSTDLTNLQGKYDADIKNYQQQLAKQSYEFAVKEFANSKNFSSKAAKRDFINSMIAKDLKMDGDKILGAEDFINSYSTENEDAFVTEYEIPPAESAPQFIAPTPGTDTSDNNGFSFNFTGVRAHN